MDKELRQTRAALKVKPEGRTLTGYAIRFNEESRIITDESGTYIEKIAPTALDRTLRENPDVFAYGFHERNSIMGRTTSGTLRLAVDNLGLGFENDAPDTTLGNDIYTLVGRGDLTDMSFGFWVRKQSKTWDTARQIQVRTIEDLDLGEISYVDIGAYSAPKVSLRWLQELRGVVRTYEDLSLRQKEAEMWMVKAKNLARAA